MQHESTTALASFPEIIQHWYTFKEYDNIQNINYKRWSQLMYIAIPCTETLISLFCMPAFKFHDRTTVYGGIVNDKGTLSKSVCLTLNSKT